MIRLLVLVCLCGAIEIENPAQLRSENASPGSLIEVSDQPAQMAQIEAMSAKFKGGTDQRVEQWKSKTMPAVDKVGDGLQLRAKELGARIKVAKTDLDKGERDQIRDFQKMSSNLQGLNILKVDAEQVITDRHDEAGSYIDDSMQEIGETSQERLDKVSGDAKELLDEGNEVTKDGMDKLKETSGEIMDVSKQTEEEVIATKDDMEKDFQDQWDGTKDELKDITGDLKDEGKAQASIVKEEDKGTDSLKKMDAKEDQTIVKEVKEVEKDYGKEAKEADKSVKQEISNEFKDGVGMIKDFQTDAREDIKGMTGEATDLSKDVAKEMTDFMANTNAEQKSFGKTVVQLDKQVGKSDGTLRSVSKSDDKETAAIDKSLTKEDKWMKRDLAKAESAMAKAGQTAEKEEAKSLKATADGIAKDGKKDVTTFYNDARKIAQKTANKMEADAEERGDEVKSAEKDVKETKSKLKTREKQIETLFKDQMEVEDGMSDLPVKADKALQKSIGRQKTKVENFEETQESKVEQLEDTVEPLVEQVEEDTKNDKRRLNKDANKLFGNLKKNAARGMRDIKDTEIDPASLAMAEVTAQNSLSKVEAVEMLINPLVAEAQRGEDNAESALAEQRDDVDKGSKKMTAKMYEKFKGISGEFDAESDKLTAGVKAEAEKHKVLVKAAMESAMRTVEATDANHEESTTQVDTLNGQTLQESMELARKIRDETRAAQGEAYEFRNAAGEMKQKVGQEITSYQGQTGATVTDSRKAMAEGLGLVLGRGTRGMDKVTQSAESDMERYEKDAYGQVQGLLQRTEGDLHQTSQGVRDSIGQLNNVDNRVKAFGQDQRARYQQMGNSMSSMDSGLDQQKKMDRDQSNARELEARQDAQKLESDISSRSGAVENRLGSELNDATYQAKNMVSNLGGQMEHASAADAQRVASMERAMNKELGRAGRRSDKLAGDATKAGNAVDQESVYLSGRAVGMEGDFKSGGVAAEQAMQRAGGASNTGLDSQVDDAAYLQDELNQMQGATKNAIELDRSGWSSDLHSIEGKLKAAMRGEKDKTAQFSTMSARLEAEGKHLLPQMDDAMSEYKREYNEIMGLTVSKEDQQKAAAAAEIDAHREAKDHLHEKFQVDGGEHVYHLNNIADVMVNAFALSRHAQDHAATKAEEWEDHMKRASELEFTHSIEDVNNLTSSVELADFSGSDISRWLSLFRHYDTGFNKKVHDKLKSLGVDIKSEIWQALHDITHEEHDLGETSKHADSDFLKHLADDEASAKDKVASLMLACDDAIAKIMAMDHLTKEEKAQLIAQLRAEAQRIASQLMNQQNGIAHDNHELTMSLAKFSALVDFANGKAVVPATALGNHAEAGINKVMKGLGSLASKYPWLESLIQTGDETDKVEALSKEDEALEAKDALLEKKIAKLETVMHA